MSKKTTRKTAPVSIDRVRHNEGTTIDRLRIDFTDKTVSEWAVDHYEESMSQRARCKQLKKAYDTIVEACEKALEFVEFTIDK